MGKQRVYGEQIIVRLYDNKRKQAFCVDFDTISVGLIPRERTYKTIGKSVATQSPTFDGWRIDLTRQKRDNYLEEFVDLLQMMNKAYKEPVKISIERIVTHTFSKNDLVSSKEFYIPPESSVLFKGIQAIGSQLIQTGVRAVDTALSKNKAYQGITQTIQGGLDVKSNVSSFFGALANNFKQPFKERMVYFDVSLANYNFDDKPKVETDEKISFNASDRKNFTEENSYRDYIENIILSDYMDRQTEMVEENREKAIDSFINVPSLGLIKMQDIQSPSSIDNAAKILNDLI